MNLSIIIPTFNEAENISRLVGFLHNHAGDKEIIVSDGGSTDDTLVIAKKAGASVVVSPQKGRAGQMNYGASLAKGDVLYFIHADTIPPRSFFTDIEIAIAEGFSFGRYRTAFDSKKIILKINAFLTRFDLFECYGGDQTMFISQKLFNEIGGFDASMKIMEDYDLVSRAKKLGRYKIIQKAALISARKYDSNSWWKVQTANYTIIQMYKKGASQNEMVERYKKLLDYR